MQRAWLFFGQVEGAKRDLHSGVFGGSVHEAMTDVVRLMGSLVDSTGGVRVTTRFDRVPACGSALPRLTNSSLAGAMIIM